MSRHSTLPLIALLCLSPINCSPVRAAELSELLRYLPSSSNMLLIVNAQKIFNSELATNENWKQDYEQTYASTPLLMPPDAQLFVAGARVNYEFLAPLWEVAVAELADEPSIDDIATRTGGTRDEVDGFQAVETQRDMYIVRLEPNVFGVRQPANRQAVARWLNQVRDRQAPALSGYLQGQAVDPREVGTDIILAFDLDEVFRESDVRRAMEASPVARESPTDTGELADVLASVRGVTLGVRVTTRIYGKIKIDFEQDTAPLAPVAQPLLMELVGEAGAMLEEFAGWKAEAAEKHLTWEGELTRSGLRKLFSFLQMDTTRIDSARQASADGAGSRMEEANKPYISKQYFQTVEKYLKDLRHERGAVSFGQIGLWYDKYARKIERMPTLYVDEDLVDYGMQTAQRLRSAAAAIQGAGIRAGARTAQLSPTVRGRTFVGGYGPYNQYGIYGYRWRPYGGGYALMQWEVQSYSAQRAAIRAEERAQAATEARDIMQEIRRRHAGDTPQNDRSL